MHRFYFLAFAIVCLTQRVVEIARNDRNVADRRPKWTAIAITAIFIGFSLGSVVETFVVDRPFRPSFAILGSCLFAAGFVIRRWVLRSLGTMWAIDVDIKPDHRLIKTGPYRFCRHPNYLAMLLEMIGFCLIPSAFYSLTVFLPLYVIALAARIRIEEAALVNRLGDEYRTYRQNTFALLPIPKW
ncbi:MAG TPA: isoprenylcysteine carboxylmethyltransferase family protein [Planctomycetaceae bacterium]|jgi:protein-S-isoprenylcysteine O-methyltransferase Ste14